MSDTSVRCWGQNGGGQLGNGTTTAESLPVTVKNSAGTGPLTGVMQISTGANSCALLSDGTVRCWGGNVVGQLGIGTTSGPQTCNGQACSTLPVEVKNPAGSAALDNVTQIAGGGNDECAVLADTSAVCWGINNSSQIGNVNAPQIASSPVVVKNDPSAQALTGIGSISVSGAHTCAALIDGTARCWGNNFWGELGNGTTTQYAAPAVVKNSTGTAALAGVVSISAGGRDTCALLADATIRCWGDGNLGEMGNGATPSHQLLPTAVLSDSSAGPLAGVTSVAVGGAHVCAVLSSGTARCWGDNGWLQLGDGALLGPDVCGSSSFCATTPVTVNDSTGIAALAGVASISAAGFNSCARLNDGSTRCWGHNAEMELGDGTDVGRCLPVEVGVVGPSAEAPTNPTGVTATAGVDKATVHWALQTGDCGTPITSFTVTASPGGATIVVSAWLNHGYGTPAEFQTSVDFYPLTPGVAYTFTVTATDAVGTSPSSTSSNAVRPLGGPSAPTAVSATARDRSATVRWTTPSRTNGSPITGYAVSPIQGGVLLGPQIFNSIATTQTVHSLINGHTYTFRVAAINANGTGVSSTQSNLITPAALPAPPKAVTASARTSSTSTGSVTVSYAAGANNGSAILRFTATCTSSDGGTTKTGVHLGAMATPITVSGVTARKTYRCRVTATNGRGTGPASAASTPITIETTQRTPRSGYWMLGAGGQVYAFGNAVNYGRAVGSPVAMATRRDGTGYWIVNAVGDVSHFGSAADHGGRPALSFGEQVATISPTPTGNGYWLFTNLGRAFAYGDAHRYGDMSGVHLNGPIIASAATPTGHGYYMVGADGGMFTFGDATFRGSMGNHHLNQPVVGLSPTPDNHGYWLVASDGGVFAFNAPFRGSMGSVRLNKPVNGLVAYGNGYLMVAADGGVFDFSDKPFDGSLGNNPPAALIIGITAFTA